MRDGTESSDEVLGQTCSTLTNHVVTSTARWMWIQFKSDGEITTSGLTGTLSTVYAGKFIILYAVKSIVLSAGKPMLLYAGKSILLYAGKAMLLYAGKSILLMFTDIILFNQGIVLHDLDIQGFSMIFQFSSSTFVRLPIVTYF